MKRTILFLLLLIVSATLFAQKTLVKELKHWEFEYNGQWLSATVPGCIHTDLLNHRFIKDPLLGTNEDSVQWVSDREWSYRTTVSLDEDQRDRQHYDLVFEGLQCYATIRINGQNRLETNNMFRRWVVQLTQEEMASNNYSVELTVTFHPTRPYDEAALKRLGYPLPDNRVFSRTAPYQQGWDWGPVLNSCGIWKPVRLEMWNGKVAERDKIEKPSKSKAFKDFPYQDVRLHRTSDSIGEAFTFTSKGKPIFVRGANWIPVHSFPILDSANKARYRHLLTSAKEANFNMIRVWGGGIYEHDYFFDLCDSLGIMVWTDFNFSCNPNPSDSAFLDNIRIEAEEQVRRLARHPCIVLWCGNNEIKNGWEDWGWQGVYNWTQAQRDEISHGIDTMFDYDGILHQAVRKYAPWVDYYPTSPLWGWGHPECTTDGDSHYWGVWWGEQPFEMYQPKTGRFMSEYGFMAYPQASTVLAWSEGQLKEKDLRRNAAEILALPVMKKHQRHGRGVEIIDKALMQYYGRSSADLTFENYLYLTQLVQSYGISIGITAHRMRQPYCMGTLYWQLNDVWPVASWSSIDSYGNWKALHYAVRDLYAETAILSERRSDSTFAFAVCNPPRTQYYVSTLDYVTFDGKKTEIGNGQIAWDKKMEPVDSLFWWSSTLTAGLPKIYRPQKGYLFMKFYTLDKNGKQLIGTKPHFLTYPKDMQLPRSKVEMKVSKRKGGQYKVTLSSATLAKDVMLSVPIGIEGTFSDNYFDILPGEKKVVTFQAADPNVEVTFKIKTLNEVLLSK